MQTHSIILHVVATVSSALGFFFHSGTHFVWLLLAVYSISVAKLALRSWAWCTLRKCAKCTRIARKQEKLSRREVCFSNRNRGNPCRMKRAPIFIVAKPATVFVLDLQVSELQNSLLGKKAEIVI